VINGRKAIHEALVTMSVDFADRPHFYINTFVNPRDKGIYFIIMFLNYCHRSCQCSLMCNCEGVASLYL